MYLLGVSEYSLREACEDASFENNELCSDTDKVE